MQLVRSHVKNCGAYFIHTGRYSEVTRDAEGQIANISTDATKQKRLARPGKNSAAATTLRSVLKEIKAK